MKKASRITYDVKLSSSCRELLTTDKSVKVMQGISPPPLNEVFVPRQCNYELCGNNFLERRGKSVRCDTKSKSSLAPKTWEILPNEIKDSDTRNF